jgi:hypothetical protein
LIRNNVPVGVAVPRAQYCVGLPSNRVAQRDNVPIETCAYLPSQKRSPRVQSICRVRLCVASARFAFVSGLL